MVTEVQTKMYIPGYYSMKGIGSNGGGGWALAHESGPLKTAQHHYGVYMAATDGVDYEKEKLRQTIVKHDSIFRQQVYELHRLYRKQRDLMSEVRSNHKKEEQPVLFASGFRYEDDKRSRCASGFPSAGLPTFGRPNDQSETMDLNKCKTPQRRPFDFDLEIPADEEDVVEGDKNGGLITRRTLNLADLNEPIEIDEDGEASGLCSDRNTGDEKIVFSEEKRQSHVYANIWSAAKQLSENCLVGKCEGIIGKIKDEIPSRTEDFRKPGESSEFLKAPVKQKIFGVEVAEVNNNNNYNNNRSRIIHVADSEPSSTLTSTKSRSEVACRKSHVEVKTLPWLTIQDSSSTSESSNVKKIFGFHRPQIDLNQCFAEVEEEEEEEEARFTGIDLEAPPPADDSDKESELDPEALTAAEALSAIPLRFLADAIFEAEDEKEEESNVDVNDEFERIVLSLPEAEREEERVYVAPPSPPPPESPSPPTRRPRRGQGRRGRQKAKDFRSEVLPGMASLTRNEVTEDLQIIEGLVRATGGTWQSSLAIKNGGRGRRRGQVVVEVEVEAEVAGIEEARLAGWGKRTRRPPRQRCPISNSLLPLKLT